ncbi:MAG: hypothetical protein JW809_15980 [Pirellulales bacterium]|nr:hypothetical protein [Pirellulales bacterium]
MDYEIHRPSKRCSATDREFTPGETYYSVLVSEGDATQRYDYCMDAWGGPPEGAIGWWKSQMPSAASKKRHWAPNDVMLQFFRELAGREDQEDTRYVLALLLVRRRVLRQEETGRDERDREALTLYCPRLEETFTVPVVVPDAARAEAIQEDLARLLE